MLTVLCVCVCSWMCVLNMDWNMVTDSGSRPGVPDNWLTVLQPCSSSRISIYFLTKKGFISPILHLCSGFMSLFLASIPDGLPDRCHCCEPAGMTACPWRGKKCHRWLSYVHSRGIWWHSLTHKGARGPSHTRICVIKALKITPVIHV